MRRLRFVLVVTALAGCGDNAEVRPPDAGTVDAAEPASPVDDYISVRIPGGPGKPRVLVYTFENYWRHYSSINCMLAVAQMATTRGFTVHVTNHPLGINARNLAEVDVVAFCVTSGSGLDSMGKADLEAWIRAGGGTVGFHSASMTEVFWPFYVGHVGTTFATHAPGLWSATVDVIGTHPITDGIADFQMTEEWYVFAQRPDTIPGATVLLAVDEDTLAADYPVVYRQGYHPIAWVNDRFGGRMFYAGFGHVPETFGDPIAIEITGRAIEWAAHQR